VLFEEIPLVFQGERYGLFIFNVALPSVDDRNVTKTKRNYAPSQNVNNISSSIHEIDLGENPDCPCALGIRLSGELQTVGISQIGVGCRHGEDYGVGFADVFHDHLADLALNVSWLISDGDFGKPR
jgi:hypothetical protein